MNITDWLTIAAILVTAWAIFYEVDKVRKLSRKTTSIGLLNDICHNDQWLNGLRLLTDLKLDQEDFNQKDFAKKKFTVGLKLDDREQKISDAIRDILNIYEFLSIAILSKSANEEIIRANLGYLFLYIYDEVKEYIKEARDKINDQTIYINYETVVNNWKEKPKIVGPID